MNWKKFVTLGILAILLISTFGTVAAQTGGTPTVAPTATGTQEPESKFFTHPIVALLGAYFGRESAPKLAVTATPAAGTPQATASATPAPGAETVETPAQVIGEEIAAYHEAGMGFGVLVKLYAMAEASVDACLKQAGTTIKTPVAATTTASAAEAPCAPANVEELVTAFNWTGLGQLFKDYGKPSVLGVGQARKEQGKQTPVVSGTTALPTLQGMGTPQPGTSAAGKPTRIPKIKPDHSTGNSNGNGNGKNK